jgi:hypothetical protein
MLVSSTDRMTGATVFAPRLAQLLDAHRRDTVFRLDPGTIGVADPSMIDILLHARPMHDSERPTFKPFRGKPITRPESSEMMQAITQDVRRALKQPPETGLDLTGEWPAVGHRYLRDLIFPHDPFRLRLLSRRKLEASHAVSRTVLGTGALLPGGRVSLDSDASSVAKHTFGKLETFRYRQKLHAMGLYRRMASPICNTVATLATNAIWLAAPFPPDTPNRDILLEALRLLPPSWNLVRFASPEYPALDDRIGPADDVLMLPLLTQRNPDFWDDPDAYQPQRWTGVDPDTLPAYLPFGHASERCWGRHLVLPLAERLLDLVRAGGFGVDPKQAVARVPLDGLLGVKVRVARTQ